ncbi:GntR family transcriptional regulator [uncultured Rubinisphaera sp.]|uniref:GntR family transcriptional regulator n=1 Tax=uncultured Rubinisphaera sp. TaxID=1678686 RepID=UPI0030D80968|tara:strand:- start:634 stop:1287 length:654 start_codon:yes stop_codon:yes gene_type:complete
MQQLSSRSLLKEKAYQQLKCQIQDSTFIPGTFLSERKLALELGMSKTPIKAALERLESEGLVSVSPQQGIMVRELSVHEIADQFEIRLALESFVLRSVTGKLTNEDIKRIRKNLQQNQQAAKEFNHTTAIKLDAEFHGIFCDCLGNQEIIRVMTQLREKMYRVIGHIYQQHEDRIESSWTEHTAIANAVISGDADLAVIKLQEHLEYGKQLLLSPRR